MNRQTLPKSMKFSVIIPTLNEEKYVGVLLNSLEKQEFKDFEVLVVDGNSKDSTCKVVRAYTKSVPNFRLIKSPKRGVAYQRNYGA